MTKTLLLAGATALLFSCTSDPKADDAGAGDKKEASTASGDSYVTDAASSVTWTGTKVGGSHTGTFAVKEGNFIVNGDQLAGGSFVIDITSLKNNDLAADTSKQHMLEGHLKSPDFFDVAKFPNAKFEISEVKAGADTASLLKGATHTITGNLTLKDNTKSVSIPAIISIKDGKLTANTEFNIDRTNWGMNYKGPNNPQDWVISKTVNLKFSISGTKK